MLRLQQSVARKLVGLPGCSGEMRQRYRSNQTPVGRILWHRSGIAAASPGYRYHRPVRHLYEHWRWSQRREMRGELGFSLIIAEDACSAASTEQHRGQHDPHFPPHCARSQRGGDFASAMIYIGLPQWSHPKWVRLGITTLKSMPATLTA